MVGAVLPPTLKCAVSAVAVLTCALISTLSFAVHDAAQDPIIHQVTDNHRPLLGTERSFQMFIEKYGKKYSTRKEYMHRLGIFAKNMIRAAEHQALDPTAVHGVTPFSDLSEEEFERMYTGMRAVPSASSNDGVSDSAPPVMDVGDLPENFDWREKGAVTEVKMQVINNY